MHLEKIEIQGFKSFANKTVLAFPKPENDNKGITAVVGPNGSGKSNVVDAIRWVLGEQSLKTLRGKKSQDVIFHGSEGKSRLGMAEVTLCINNHDKVIPIEYAELTITRRLYRDGESEYLVNKAKAKLSDIIMLLAKANFGQKSFSIVGQGMIDYILQAGFKERKEFFDEAVGVKQYQIKRHQTINDLRRTKLNLEQINITLTELEPRLRLLSRQVKKLEKRQEIKKELTELQIGYYGNIYFGLKDKINTVNGELKEKHKKNKDISDELLNLQKKLSVFAKEYDRDEKFNKLKEELDSYNNQKNSLFKELTILKGEINIEYKKQGQLDLAWITKSKDELKNNAIKIKQELERLEGEKKIAERKINNLNSSFHEINKNLEEIKKELGAASRMDTNEQSDDWKNLLRKIITDHQDIIKLIELARTADDFQEIKKKAHKIQDNLNKLKEKSSPKEEKEAAEKLNAKITELSKSQENISDSKNKILGEINSLEVILSITKEKIKLSKSRLAESEENLEKINKEIKQSEFDDKNIALKEYRKKEGEINEKLGEVEEKIKAVSRELDNFNKNEQEKKDKVFALQEKTQTEQLKLNRSQSEINELMIELTKLETRKEDLEREVREELDDLKKLERDKINKNSDIDKIYKLKSQLELIGGIDPETLDEYKETKERFEFLSEQVKDLEETGIKLEKIIEDLDKIIKRKFDESFSKINNNFTKYFRTLFEGGEAKLVKTFRQINEDEETEEKEEVEDAENTENEEGKKKAKKKMEMGIEIHAAPHGKKLKDIGILSGGERSLTSIALICAIISINPSPFVILDEVDAALDEANSVRFANIVKNLSHKTQFITISHNRATMEVAKVLYGVTMQEKGVSKILSLSLEDAKEKAAR